MFPGSLLCLGYVAVFKSIQYVLMLHQKHLPFVLVLYIFQAVAVHLLTQVVKKLDQLLGLYGEAPLLLRSEDISLHDDSAQTLREKKVSDLHNRVARIEETEHAVLLSVHQNTFPDGKYHGAQVFYSNGELSQPLAQLTQETLRAALDPGNTREAKPIPDSVYLMNHITCPAILVECGFLSNAEEELLLQSGAYQTKLASALAASWLQWLDEEGRGEGFSLQKGGVASE